MMFYIIQKFSITIFFPFFSRFEQAFINSFISSVAKTKDSYFWIALQDENNTGEYTWKTVGQRPEPMQYTHWNTHQPSESPATPAHPTPTPANLIP